MVGLLDRMTAVLDRPALMHRAGPDVTKRLGRDIPQRDMRLLRSGVQPESKTNLAVRDTSSWAKSSIRSSSVTSVSSPSRQTTNIGPSYRIR